MLASGGCKPDAGTAEPVGEAEPARRAIGRLTRSSATVLINGDHAMPVTAGLKSLNGQWVSAWHLVSAGSIVAALPPVIMFFLLQKHFIAGLTLGATKG